MLNKLALAATAAVAMLGLSNEAHAADAYQSGMKVGNVCADATVSYWGDPGITPKTGYVSYVRIEINAVGSSCASSVSWADLILPPGAVLGILPDAPVQCFRTINGVRSELIGNAFEGGCFQQRTNVGGIWSYGWSTLHNRGGNGDKLEVFVPIWYTQSFTDQNLSAPVRNSVGDMTPGKLMSVPYQAAFDSYAVPYENPNGTEVTLGFRLFNFYKTGSVLVEFGTTPSFGMTTPPATTSTAYAYYPSVTVPLTGLQSNTTYYWRPLITVPGFPPFYGATQTFTTIAQIVNPNPAPVCWRYPCVRR